jgi:hypothetical protein
MSFPFVAANLNTPKVIKRVCRSTTASPDQVQSWQVHFLED